MSTRTIISLAAALMTGFASAQLTQPERKFLKDAAMGNKAEMMLGRLAADRGGSEDIRDFGRQLAADHNQAEDRVIRIASRDDVNLPARIEAGAQQFYDRAERLRGRAFDRAFRAYMIRDHRKDIRTYERFSRMARDPEIRRYATRTLPDLRKHLQLAESAKV